MVKRKSPSPSHGHAAVAPSPPRYPNHCKYRSGKCSNPRGVKTTGEQHSLCDEHRERANESQRRSQKRSKRDEEKPARWIHAMGVVSPCRVPRSDCDSLAIKPCPAIGHETLPGTCKYSQEGCREPRAIKTNGEPHRFCETHRVQAKHDQRKYMEAQKQKKRIFMEQAHMSAVVHDAYPYTARFQVLVADVEDKLAFHHREGREWHASPAGARPLDDDGSRFAPAIHDDYGTDPIHIVHGDISWDSGKTLLDDYPDLVKFLGTGFDLAYEE